jgi:hypothetical protein
MGVVNILKEGYQIAQKRGLRDAFYEGKAFLREATLRNWHSFSGTANRGEPIYEQDWDLLVVLDACRFDALQRVASDYAFLSSVGSTESVGSYSLAWLEKNFTETYADKMAQTAMISGNPFTETALSAAQFGRLEEVWRHTWDEDVGTIRPRPLTDTAISVARDDNPDRMIVHYMQPHDPFTTHPELQRGRSASEWADATDKSVWMSVQAGELLVERARDAYYDELRLVLEEVELLLDNVDADTAVITADHGEAMGESGIYGHTPGVAIDALRVVPWAETTAVDTGSHTPDETPAEVDGTGTQTDRLRDLGYLE